MWSCNAVPNSARCFTYRTVLSKIPGIIDSTLEELTALWSNLSLSKEEACQRASGIERSFLEWGKEILCIERDSLSETMSNILALRTDADALATVTGDKFDDVYCNTFKTKLDHTREEWERLMEVWTLQQVDECNWNSYPSTFIPGKLDGYCSSDSGRSRSLKPSPTRKRPRSPTPSTLKACRAWNHLSMMQGDWIDPKRIKFKLKLKQNVPAKAPSLLHKLSVTKFWPLRGGHHYYTNVRLKKNRPLRGAIITTLTFGLKNFGRCAGPSLLQNVSV